MPTHDCQVAVFGSGPVGMVAALELSKRQRTALITCGLPSADEATRVEAVPASLLALLVEYGIHPGKVGVERLYETRLVAWASDECVESASPASAHVERPALDLALLDALTATRRVEVITRPPSACPDDLARLRGRGVRLIDATGRKAVTAAVKRHAARPWAARTFIAAKRDCAAGGELRVAALPDGYAYRLGSAAHLVLGVVGRGKALAGGAAALEVYLSEHGAGWILAGLMPLSDMTPGRIAPASVQWTEGGDARRIGDAALARDALSSQGLAAGISEALYAAAVVDESGEVLLSIRQREQRAAHLRSLAHSIATCRFRTGEVWQEYEMFVARYLTRERPQPRVALRVGTLQSHP
ncbi:MAG TPA: hypothetical protein VIQ24_20150 [Pyrinomonadaceae bacterium]